MAKSTLSYGSSGEDVKILQKALNSVGYSLDVDGKFGAKTQSAVKSYQQKNGLSVDGIVGVNTWNSLSKSGSTTKKTTNSATSKTVTTKTQNKKTTIKEPVTKKRPTYEKSENITSLENALTNWENSKPSDYESKYSSEIESVLNGILNREKFNYNVNADPLYNQYKEQYINNGKTAMLDTVANASALTGGYANSYAVTAGNQSYNEYLNDLNNVVLNLYDRAYSKYVDEGETMLDKITILRELDGDDYEKYRDELSEYYSDGEYLLNKLTSMSDAEYEAFLQEVNAFESERDYEYQKYIDALEQQNFYDELAMKDENFNEEMAFKKAEAERDQRNKDREYSLAASKARSSSSSSSSSKNSSNSDNSKKVSIMPKTYQQFIYLTGYSGIMTESEFNLRKAAKEEYGNYENYIKEMFYKYGDGRNQ